MKGENMSGAIVSAETKGPKKGPKVLDEVRIKRAMDGGHVVTHHYEGYQHEPKSYSFGKNESARAAAHVARHTGMSMAGSGTEGTTVPREEGEAE